MSRLFLSTLNSELEWPVASQLLYSTYHLLVQESPFLRLVACCLWMTNLRSEVVFFRSWSQ